jgi:hypothetical protein
MLRWMVLMACVAIGGCGGSRSAPSAESSSPMEGTYEFSASTPNQLMRGRINKTSSGLGIDFETSCHSETTTRPRPRGMPSGSSVAGYYCSGAWLTFDRRNPGVAKWYASVEQPRRREVCARYETQNGRQVCVSRSTETYYVYETRSGGIQVRRVP